MVASRRRETVVGASNGLSVEAAHHYARIYSAARAGCMAELRRAGCDEAQAEDIFAATLERIMRKLDPVGEGYGQAQTVVLLKQACRQKLIDERRHRDVLRIVPLTDAISRSDPTSQSAAEAAEAREAVAIGREAISSLPERDRRVFLQRHHLDLSPEEIVSRNPGLSPRTYRKLIQRANARALAAFEEIDSGARCAEMRRDRLRGFVAEESSEAERRAVETHLRHCRPCRVEAARMRGGLHEIASGVAVLLVAEAPGEHRFGELPARLLEAAGSGGEGLVGATRALRERLRELAIRAAGALPSSGGEVTAGQLAGISAAKVASVCAAGALTASCLAAGIMPGVGGLGLAGPGAEVRPPQPARHSVKVPRPNPPPLAPTPSRSSATSPVKPKPRTGSQREPAGRSTPRVPDTGSPRPTLSDVQTGTEFGGEAAGAGVPLQTQSSGAEESGASSAGATEESRSADVPEFGF